MQTCPTCGAENIGKKAACWNCWAPLDSVEAPAGKEAAGKAPGFSLRLPWKPLIALVVVAALGAGAYVFAFTSKPEAVAEQYLDAALNGLFTDVNPNAAKLRETLVAGGGGQLLPGALALANGAEISGVANVTGETATIPATMRLTLKADQVNPQNAASAVAMMQAFERSFTADITLVRDGSKWKVDEGTTGNAIISAVIRQVPPPLQDAVRRGQIPVSVAPTTAGLSPAVTKYIQDVCAIMGLPAQEIIEQAKKTPAEALKRLFVAAGSQPADKQAKLRAIPPPPDLAALAKAKPAAEPAPAKPAGGPPPAGRITPGR